MDDAQAKWLRTVERTTLTQSGHNVVEDLEPRDSGWSQGDHDRYYYGKRKALLRVWLVERAARRAR